MKEQYLNRIGVLADKLESQANIQSILIREMQSTIDEYVRYLETELEAL